MPKPANSDKIISKAAIALFKDKKILMARDDKNSEAFYTPGGKIEAGETDTDCVIRETKEELDVDVVKDSLKFLGEFEAAAHNKPDKRVNIRLFTGKVIGEPRPSSEVVELRYLDTSDDPKHLTPVLTEEMFPWLKDNGYIN